MKKILKIFEVIFRIVLIMIIIINLISIITVKVLKSPYPKVFGYSYFSVVSGSMDPYIEVGDEVVIKLTKDVKVNDVITFTEDGAIVTHRLMEIDGETIITKGDNNNSYDEPGNINDIIGKVALVIPHLGKIKFTITNPTFIVVVIIAYLLYFLVVEKATDEEEKKDKE